MKKMLFLYLLTCLTLNMSFSQLKLTSSAFVAIGGTASSGSSTIFLSAGQPTPAATASDNIFSLNGGFLNTMLDVQGPIITPLTSQEPTAGTEAQINANVSDYSGVKGAMVHYRQGGSIPFDSVSMIKSGSTYQGIIPGSGITAKGLEYYISAKDSFDNPSRNPSSGVNAKRVFTTDLVNPNAQPAGADSSGYKLISLPIDADKKSPSDVLAALGPYDNTKWRFFGYKTDTSYTEYPNTESMAPGKSFWLIVRDEGKIIHTGSGRSILTNAVFPVALHPGWNFIGDPFDFSIPLGKLSLTSGRSLDIRSFDKQWLPVTYGLNPFDGYIISNSAATADILNINPQLFPVALQKDVPAASWAVKIKARCQEAKDEDNIAAASASASDFLDAMDKPEPPVIGGYVSVYFPHPEWNGVFSKYSTDTRQEPTDGEVWNFDVKTNIPDRVYLEFEGLSSVPGKFEVWLLDNVLKTTRNLRESAKYNFSGPDQHSGRHLSLIVGTSKYTADKLAEGGTIPSSFELSQNYPNPFNPSTTIRYALPQVSRVVLKVYNVLGQEIVTLADGIQQSGYQSVEFDGTNLPSGVYYYRLSAEPQAGNHTSAAERFIDTKRLLLIK